MQDKHLTFESFRYILVNSVAVLVNRGEAVIPTIKEESIYIPYNDGGGVFIDENDCYDIEYLYEHKVGDNSVLNKKLTILIWDEDSEDDGPFIVEPLVYC